MKSINFKPFLLLALSLLLTIGSIGMADSVHAKPYVRTYQEGHRTGNWAPFTLVVLLGVGSAISAASRRR